MLHDFTLTTLMFIIAVLFTLAFLLYLRNRALEALLDRVPEKVVEKTCEIFPQLPNVQIGGLDFVLTCSACPEQMDVYRLGQQVGYLRLRHGHFTERSRKPRPVVADECVPKINLANSK
jgi:hypothetical protein